MSYPEPAGWLVAALGVTTASTASVASSGTIPSSPSVASLPTPALSIPIPAPTNGASKHVLYGIETSFSATAAGLATLSIIDWAAPSQASQVSKASNSSTPSVPSKVSVGSAPTVYTADLMLPANTNFISRWDKGFPITQGGGCVITLSAPGGTLSDTVNIHGRTV